MACHGPGAYRHIVVGFLWWVGFRDAHLIPYAVLTQGSLTVAIDRAYEAATVVEQMDASIRMLTEMRGHIRFIEGLLSACHQGGASGDQIRMLMLHRVLRTLLAHSGWRRFRTGLASA